jgi:hypothetical protein
MDSINFQDNPTQPSIHFGHFGIVMLAAILLLGISWMKNPALFVLHPVSQTADADAPHYVAYVTPPEDLPQPAVLGASTNEGPSIIQDDGTVVPVDMGQVLAASTQGVQLSLNDIKVNAVPESSAAVQKYFSDAKQIESGFAGDANFGAALTSGNQEQINQYAQKLTTVRDALQKLAVPPGLVKLQQLKIVQYNSSIGLLQNFTQGDTNPDLVNEDMQQFLKSQQDLDAENAAVAQKYPALDPDAALYVSPDGTPVDVQPVAAAGSPDNSLDSSSLDDTNATQ